MNCIAIKCDRPARYKATSLCEKHYQKLRRLGNPNAGKNTRPRGTGGFTTNGYITLQMNNVPKLEHIWIAERAFGGPLPKGAVVHHMDGNGLNNSPTNLVVCPSEAYHRLLHRRIRALDASGHADWLKCEFCHRYDEPLNI